MRRPKGQSAIQTLIMIPGLGSDGDVWRRTVAVLRSDAPCSIGDTLSDLFLPKMAERILAEVPTRFALGCVSMRGLVVRRTPERVPGWLSCGHREQADAPSGGYESAAGHLQSVCTRPLLVRQTREGQ